MSKSVRHRKPTPHPKASDLAHIDWTKLRAPRSNVPRKAIRQQNADGSKFIFSDARQFLSHKRNNEGSHDSDASSTASMKDAALQNNSLGQSQTSQGGRLKKVEEQGQRPEVKEGKRVLKEDAGTSSQQQQKNYLHEFFDERMPPLQGYHDLNGAYRYGPPLTNG